jgi:hypothetical protein
VFTCPACPPPQELAEHIVKEGLMPLLMEHFCNLPFEARKVRFGASLPGSDALTRLILKARLRILSMLPGGPHVTST